MQSLRCGQRHYHTRGLSECLQCGSGLHIRALSLRTEIDKETAEEIADLPETIALLTKEALEIIEQKKNIRILTLEDISKPVPKTAFDMKKVAGGLLVQQYNSELYDEADVKVVTKKQPTEQELRDMFFGMKVVKHVKSNGICLVKGNSTVGVGPGQTNRVGAAEIAIRMAGERAKGSVLASDAFFPFPDCVEAAAAAGITAIIQPGGSIRDQESIDKCDEMGIAMVFTGKRHFKH